MDASFGIEYTPATLQENPTNVEAYLRSLNPSQALLVKGQIIKFVRVQWMDYTSVVRCRILPVKAFKDLMRTGARPAVNAVTVTLGMVGLAVADEFGIHGEYLVRIDADSLRLFASEPGVAVVFGYLEEKTPRKIDGSVEVGLCPRTILRKQVEKARKDAGIEFLVGFETEFILLKSTDPIVAVSEHAWSTSSAFPTGSVQSTVLAEISTALSDSGIDVLMYHAEAAPGQYELVTGPLLPLAAADALVHTRETIRSVASKHGLRATFAPRIHMTSTGSSMHTHISVHRTSDDASSKPKDGLASEESSFLQGILSALPTSLTALTLPTRASFRRVMDGVWSGGTYVCWGTESREAPVRLTNASSPRSRNFELRFVDGTANPHLVLAAFVGAGARAVANQVQLKQKDSVLEDDVRTVPQFSEEKRKELGIEERLPLSWEESREKFAKSQLAQEIFGELFVKKYLSVNKLLDDTLGDQDQPDGLRKLVEFY